MGPIHCGRHGRDNGITTSKGIAARIRQRGQFLSGELVKVSLDRRKYSLEMWMLHAELDEHEVDATLIDRVVHVTEFPKIAALERARVMACSACLDELLVRSGEVPYKPTTAAQAFDTSVVAADAKWPRGFARCELHGLILPTRTSADIEAAILSIDVIRDCHVVRVTDGSKKHEPMYWFSEAFLRERLGPNARIEDSALRLDDEAGMRKLREAGEWVCERCLRETLKRSGLSGDDTPA